MLDFGQIGVQNNERQPTEMVNETGYFVTINQQVRMGTHDDTLLLLNSGILSFWQTLWDCGAYDQYSNDYPLVN